MRKTVSFLLVLVMSVGLVLPARMVEASEIDWETAMDRSLEWIKSNVSPNPVVGSVGGEWAVLALTRANRVTADDPWIVAWLEDLEGILTQVDRLAVNNDIQNPPSTGTFPSAMRRWTDFQRVTIALTALGIDASDFNGRDLTEIYRTFVPGTQRHALNQTINVDTFALIALDTLSYDGDRDDFIQALLDAQRDDGTWSLNPNRPSSTFDLDVTAMALIALAPYYYRGDERVTDAVERGLTWLRAQTFPDPESVAQMIVVLTALGPEFANEIETYVTQMLRWFDPATGGFRRPTPNDPVNLMATEQAAYGLVAYWRFVNDMNHLYDMSDAFEDHNEETADLSESGTGSETGTGTASAAGNAEAGSAPAVIGLPGRHADVRGAGVISTNTTFADIQNHANRTAIETLAARGIVDGRSENTFAPDAAKTRAEFAEAIARGLGLPARPGTVFTDVPSNNQYSGAVGIAFYYELMSGTTPTTFNPSGTITRQEAAVIIMRAARLAGMDTNLNDTETLNILAMFGDYRTADNWAWNSLAFCYREGILDDAEFNIRPLAEITRGEVSEMLYQMLKRANLI